MITQVTFCLCFVAAAICAPAEAPAAVSSTPVPIVSEEINVNPNGTFSFSYESGDGSKVQEAGDVSGPDPEHQGVHAAGSYSFVAPDGRSIDISYVADENGYQPQGDAIPVPPPLPESIARALKFIEEHSTPEPEPKH